MNRQKRSDNAIQTAVKNLFLGIAPEKLSEINSFWDDLQLQFCLFDDGQSALMEAGAYRYIHFNHRTLRVFWVSAFAAWEAYTCLSTAILSNKEPNLNFLEKLIQIALDVKTADDPESISLAELPEPGQLPNEVASPEMRAAAELAMFATGWAILHEVRHLQHQQQGTSSPGDNSCSARAEELSCDEFATDFLISDLSRYASTHGFDEDSVRKKRHIGIYFAAFALVVLSHPNWEVTDSHPSVQERIDRIFHDLRNDNQDEAMCVALLAFTGLRKLWPSAPMFSIT